MADKHGRRQEEAAEAARQGWSFTAPSATLSHAAVGDAAVGRSSMGPSAMGSASRDGEQWREPSTTSRVTTTSTFGSQSLRGSSALGGAMPLPDPHGGPDPRGGSDPRGGVEHADHGYVTSLDLARLDAEQPTDLDGASFPPPTGAPQLPPEVQPPPEVWAPPPQADVTAQPWGLPDGGADGVWKPPAQPPQRRSTPSGKPVGAARRLVGVLVALTFVPGLFSSGLVWLQEQGWVESIGTRQVQPEPPSGEQQHVSGGVASYRAPAEWLVQDVSPSGDHLVSREQPTTQLWVDREAARGSLSRQCRARLEDDVEVVRGPRPDFGGRESVSYIGTKPGLTVVRSCAQGGGDVLILHGVHDGTEPEILREAMSLVAETIE